MIRSPVGFASCLFILAGCGGEDDDRNIEQSANPAQPSSGFSAPSVEAVLASCEELCTAEQAGECISSAAACIVVCEAITPLISPICRATKLAAQQCELQMNEICGYDCLEIRMQATRCEADAL